MIVVDASIWTSFLIADDVHYLITTRWLADQTGQDQEIVAPNILLPEVAGAVTRRTGEARLGDEALQDMLTSPFLRLVQIDESLARLAGTLAVRLRLKGADAVYVAVASHLGIPLATWDREQRERAASVITTIEPR